MRREKKLKALYNVFLKRVVTQKGVIMRFSKWKGDVMPLGYKMALYNAFSLNVITPFKKVL